LNAALARFLRLECRTHTLAIKPPIAGGRRKPPIAGAALRGRVEQHIREHKHMESEYAPQTIVALYTTLADAEMTLHELEAAGVPYPATRLAALCLRDRCRH
jgi:hypothetical protein